jgi:hypothetical protein
MAKQEIKTRQEKMTRKDDLAASRRRTRKKLRVPMAGNPANLKKRRCHRDLNERNECRSRNNRRRRVHHNAQWAMIGVSICRMRVCDLRERQQDKQGQTYQCHHESRSFAAGIL